MRFSSPKTASRLPRPMSESTTATFFPCIASAVPRFAVVVVLPTPPFPEVIVITLLSMLATPDEGFVQRHVKENISLLISRLVYHVALMKKTSYLAACERLETHPQTVRDEQRSTSLFTWGPPIDPGLHHYLALLNHRNFWARLSLKAVWRPREQMTNTQ